MEELTIFNYEEKEIRSVKIDGEVWWVLKDVCDVLEVINPSQVAERLDEDEKQKVDPILNIGSRSNEPIIIINESGLYKTILRSRKPQAKPFINWVTKEVLPSIRKTEKPSQNKDNIAVSEVKVIAEREVLEKDFKVYGDFENPLFVAQDVAEWIEHSNSREMLKTVDEDEKLLSVILTSGQRREVQMLTEYGLYEVLMQSRKPVAKQFKKEVKKILKEIRMTGMYISPAKAEQVQAGNEISRLWEAFFEEKKKTKNLEIRLDYLERSFKSSHTTIIFEAKRLAKEIGKLGARIEKKKELKDRQEAVDSLLKEKRGEE